MVHVEVVLNFYNCVFNYGRPFYLVLKRELCFRQNIPEKIGVLSKNGSGMIGV